jgi:hypothetical protein
MLAAMVASDSWQTWRQVQQARDRLERHLDECPECRRWQGKRRLWIQVGRLTPLPLCDQGTRLARSWSGELRRARALRGGSAHL